MTTTSQPPPPLLAPAQGLLPVRLSPADRLRVAVQAGCHPDSVRRYENGGKLQSTTVGRIERALRNLDFAPIIAARARTSG